MSVQDVVDHRVVADVIVVDVIDDPNVRTKQAVAVGRRVVQRRCDVWRRCRSSNIGRQIRARV